MKLNKKLNLRDLDVFERKINLSLLNEVMAFCLDTTENKWYEIKKRWEGIPFFQEVSGKMVSDSYGFQYLGEILERYEERCGSSVKDLRALALAIGYLNQYLGEKNFIGNQKKDFIQRIVAQGADDIYFMGALYLLADNEDEATFFWEQCVEQDVQKTEELIFLLSLKTPESVYPELRENMVRLLGSCRTIETDGNSGVFAWVIGTFFDMIRKDRKKEAAVLKALSALPSTIFKEKIKHYQTLQDNGYNAEEIAFLNYTQVLHKPISKTLREKGIAGERIASEFCKIFLQGNHGYSENIYCLLKYALNANENFAIKCDGYRRMIEVLRDADNVVVTDPEILYAIREEIKGEEWYCCFEFDILDKKWDILAEKMQAKEYQNFFEQQLLYRIGNPENNDIIKQWLDRYTALTGIDYLNEYFKTSISVAKMFAYFADHGIVSLTELLVSCAEQPIENTKVLLTLWNYSKKIPNRISFDFFDYLFSHYTRTEVEKIFGKREAFYASFFSPYSYYNRNKMNFKLDFLTKKEQLKVFYWIAQDIFYRCPNQYGEFLMEAVQVKQCRELFSYEELREWYRVIQEFAPEWYREKYSNCDLYFLTEQEREYIKRRKNEQRKREEEKRIREKEAELYRQFDKAYDGTMASLKKVYYGDYKDREIALRVVYKFQDRLLPDDHNTFKKEELCSFIEMMKKEFEREIISWSEYKAIVNKLEEGEKIETENSGTVENNAIVEKI